MGLIDEAKLRELGEFGWPDYFITQTGGL